MIHKGLTSVNLVGLLFFGWLIAGAVFTTNTSYQPPTTTMIVMKFGGTSVEDATAIRRLVSIVRQQLERQPIVVVSAMARVTNGLLDCARLSAEGKDAEVSAKLADITARHYAAADDLALPAERESLRAALETQLVELTNTLDAIQRGGNVTAALSDSVSAQGELLSSLLVAAAFRADGISSERIDIRPAMRTNDDFMRAAIDFDTADPLLHAAFTAQVAAGRVPVTQGFIGSTADGRTTTIGRGGSDYSASIIGAAVDATAIEIWTDVDGMMTTDPRIVPEDQNDFVCGSFGAGVFRRESFASSYFAPGNGQKYSGLHLQFAATPCAGNGDSVARARFQIADQSDCVQARDHGRERCFGANADGARIFGATFRGVQSARNSGGYGGDVGSERFDDAG
jgi:hypothetical protein